MAATVAAETTIATAAAAAAETALAVAAGTTISAPFKLGKKQLHLPNFVITLHRQRWLSAHHATFTVPLWFSKLDLRDYLYNAYAVRTLSIRSYIKLQRIQQGKNTDKYVRPQVNRWHRPQSVKRMTVELERPFVWPEEPKEFGAWNKEQRGAAREEQRKMQKAAGSTSDAMVDEERRGRMREQAKALLEGRARWKPARA